MKGGGSVTKYAVGGLICILFAAAVARSPVAEAAGRDEPATEIYDTIYDSIPLDEVETILQEMKEDDIEFSIRDYVNQVIRGEGELSLAGIGDP